MSKKNKKAAAGNVEKKEVKKIEPAVAMDAAKKEAFKTLLESLIQVPSFPKITKEKIDELVELHKLPEKTLKAFCGKLEKFSVAFSKKDKAKKKKSKEIAVELMATIQEIATVTAGSIATKLLKTAVTFEKLVVLKKSKKENANSNGKAIFKATNGKEYFLCWDYRNLELFVGSTLHELTKEIKEKEKI